MTSNSIKRPGSLRSDCLESVGSTTDRPAFRRRTLAVGISALILGLPATAQDENDPLVLDPVHVEGTGVDTNPYAENGAPYKARISGDSRHLRALADTPKTITVLTQTQLQESGRSDLRDILAAQPGITLGTGENGNAFGDRYIIRGHEARSDVFVDGLRDPGMTTRESFATEQVEITKGPSSTFAGRGSTGGAVNGISKQATAARNFNRLDLAGGTDDYRRITLDDNRRINDTTAIRTNLLHGYEEVPDRAPADRERNGLAVSITNRPNANWNLVGDIYYLDAEDTPDLGTYIVPDGGAPVADLPVYLQDGDDFLESTVATGTLRATYDDSQGRFRIENITRYGTTDNGYVVTGARGSERHETDPIAPGAPTFTLSTHQGWQDVDYFANQFNVFNDVELGSLTHELIWTAEYSNIDVLNGVYNVDNLGSTNCVVSGRGGNASDSFCGLDGSGNVVDNLNSVLDRQITRGLFDSDYQIDTVSVSLMDTVDFNDRWSGFFGARYDHFDYDNTVIQTDRTTGERTATPFEYSDGLWNGHAGVMFNINDDANVYFSYSTSTNINGGESDLGGNCGYGGVCGDPAQVVASDPETTRNLELGTKWQLNGDRLLATAAVFQITKDDVMESVGDDDYETLGTLNTGENRVDGVEFSLVGNIGQQWQLQFGASFMESEVLDSIDPENIGRTLSNFADESVFLQARYQVTPKLSLGATTTYSSELYAGQPDSAAGFNDSIDDYSYRVPSYTVVDLFANYQISPQLNIRANVGNATDKDYYLAGYRSGAFTYIGDARNARVNVTYSF